MSQSHLDFWTFLIRYLWIKFSENWSTAFCLEILWFNTQLFRKKLPCQKSMLAQIECWVQNWLIKKNEKLPVTTTFFWKNCFSIIDLIYQLPKCHVRNLELKGVSSMFSLFEAIFLMFVSFSGNFNCLIINSTLKNCQQSLKLCTLKFL